MKNILDKKLLKYYIDKYKVTEIFHEDIIDEVIFCVYEIEETILEPESKLQYYYLLVDGKIKVNYLFENGKSRLLKFYDAFITIGDLELLKDLPVRCQVEAVEESYFILVPVSLIKEKYTHLNFFRHLAESLSDKLDATINNSSYNSTYPLINRLSSYLLEYLKPDKDYIILRNPFKDIAEFLGTTYRHLNRTLNELEEKQIIRCNQNKIYVLNEEALRDLSKKAYMRSLL